MGKEIKQISKKVTADIGEVDSNGICLGRCPQISNEVTKQLRARGYNADVVPILIRTQDGGYSFGGHYAVIMPDDGLVVDSQLWQITNHRVDLNRRKVVFTYAEYNKKGLGW